MNNLTRYWRRKKLAIQALLAAHHEAAIPGKPVILTWFDALAVDLTVPPFPWETGIGTAPPPTTKTPEDALDKALARLKNRHIAITDATVGGVVNPDRRSARLARMVQAAIHVSPNGRGFYSSVADATMSGTGGFSDYREAVRVASSCAARFLDRAKNTGVAGGPGAIADALERVAAANRDPVLTPPAHLPDPVLEEIDELVEAIRKAVARGGLGDGSAYWPSIFISSSSSGG